MTESTFKLNFHQRRLLTSNSKTYYYVVGLIEIAVGIFGLIKPVDGLSALFFVLLIGGIVSILIAIIGKSLTKETNYISINSDIIEYKNSMQKPKQIKLDKFFDVKINSKKIEFVMTNQQVKIYDFSVFSDIEIERLHDKIEELKSKIKDK